MAYCTFSRAATSPTDISLKGLSVFVPGKQLLIDVDLKLSFRKRYAIVAPNGAGKTVLMKLIATRQIPITIEKTIYLVDQILLHPSGTCLRYVIDADTRREDLRIEEEEILQAIESGADEQQLEDRLERLEHVQDLLSIVEDTKAKASKILSGLGFSEAMKNGPTESLSGGWLMRLSLARALLMSPDILHLDEPTNHLDSNPSSGSRNICRHGEKREGRADQSSRYHEHRRSCRCDSFLSRRSDFGEPQSTAVIRRDKQFRAFRGVDGRKRFGDQKPLWSSRITRAYPRRD